MPIKALRSWLRLDGVDQAEPAPLRDLLDALDRLEAGRARYLARFAYLLGRVAHADRHVSAEETRAMEAILMKEGHLSAEQAMLVVGLARTSNLLFGGTADYLIAQEFAANSTYEEKLGLVGCLFAVSATDQAITMGLGSILASRKILLIALGESKASIIRETLENEVTARNPASYLRDHEDVSVLVDLAAAKELAAVTTPWASTTNRVCSVGVAAPAASSDRPPAPRSAPHRSSVRVRSWSGFR